MNIDIFAKNVFEMIIYIILDSLEYSRMPRCLPAVE